MKIWIITSGGDWADASVNLVATDKDLDMQALNDSYRNWYKQEYLPEYHNKQRPAYLTFTEWLETKGYTRKPNANEAEEYYVD